MDQVNCAGALALQQLALGRASDRLSVRTDVECMGPQERCVHTQGGRAKDQGRHKVVRDGLY
eukprot:gene2228-8816_t